MSASKEELIKELEQLRREQESPQDELLRLRGLQGSVEPFELPQPSSRTPIFGQRIGAQPRDQFTPEQRELAAQGVDITSGSPVGRFASGFSQNEALQAQDLEKRLSKHFNQPVTVQRGPGGLEFINPENNRRTLFDEVTSTFRDIADVAGPAIPAVAATAGEVAGGPLGALAGGAAGEALRRGIGNFIGVREETGDQFVAGSAGVGITEGAFSKGADLATSAVQKLNRTFFKPEVVPPEAAERLLREAEPAQELADEIAARTGQPFQPRTAQLTQDPQLLVADEIARRSGRFGADIRKTQQRNETTLEAFFDDINPVGDVENTQVGRSIKTEAREQIQPRVDTAEDVTKSVVNELEEAVRQLPRATDAQTVSELSAASKRSLKILKDQEDEAWVTTREAYGHNPDTALSEVKIPVAGELETTLKRLQAEARQAIDASTASGKTALIPEKLRPSSDKQSVFTEILPDQFSPQAIKENTVDLHQLQVHLSALRRRKRLARKNEVITDPAGRDINRVIAELENARATYLKQTNPELLVAIENAEGLTRTRAGLFDDGIVGQLVRKENGQYQLRDKELIGRTVASGDREAVEHLVAALDNHPAGVPTLQKGFLAFYRREVVQGGIPDGRLHKKFIEDHGETLDILFPNNRTIRQLGELERQATRRIERFERFQSAVDKSFRGKIQDIAPERIAEDVFTNKFSVKELRRLISLADAAGVKTQYQKAIGNQIKRRFITTNSGIQLRGLETFVSKSKERLTAVYGPEYVRDMNKLLRGLADIRTSGSGIQTTKNPTLFGAFAEALTRVTVARPLSPGGVGLTRLFRFQNLALERAFSEVATNPQALKAIIANGKRDIRSRSVNRLLSVLGASALVIDFNETAAGTAIEDLIREEE